MDELRSQIDQMKLALVCASEEDKAGLQMMIDELEKLVTDAGPSGEDQNQLNTDLYAENGETLSKEDEEFRLFQAELAALECSSDTKVNEEGPTCSKSVASGNIDDMRTNKDSSTITSDDLEQELAALEGMKCKAPHEHHWGQMGYYNAVVMNVEDIECESLDTIFVRVLFVQPVVESMQPCPFYMDNRCHYDDSSCKFSHGEIVSLAQLKEYVEPDFSTIGTGSRVLAKYSDGLWYKATIVEISESGNCDLKYDSYEGSFTVPLHETSPMYDGDEVSLESGSDSSSSDSDGDNGDDDTVSDVMLFQIKSTGPLGEWEQYTKGIGSKLMAKMGYVMGTGLGPRGDGRVEPVDAVVLPRGRSLDACMEIKEKAGKGNIFSAEKRLKHQKKKEAQRTKREEEKKKEKESVFNFLNTKLSIAKENDKKKHVIHAKDLNKETSKNLNKKMLNLGENIKQVNKDIAKLKESMKRHEGRDHQTAEKFKLKLASMEDHLNELKQSEITVESEQRQRNDKKKLTIF